MEGIAMRLIGAVLVVLMACAGCKDEAGSIAQSAGSKVGETLTDFASGVGEGVDRQLEVTVEPSERFAEFGLSQTVAKSRGLKQGISVYFIAEKPFNGRMIAKAFNAAGVEIGRSKVDVTFDADDAKYVSFDFDTEMDSQLVERYQIDVRDASEIEPAAVGPPAEKPAAEEPTPET
jgi:hypothetical protein